VHMITVSDLPEPFCDQLRRKTYRPWSPGRPNAWPKAPKGFKVQLYADGLSRHTARHTCGSER